MKYISDKITFTPAMQSFAEEIFEEKLKKLVYDSETAEVKMTILSNYLFKIDLCADKFRVQASGKDFYATYIEAANKLKHIITKNNKKTISKKRTAAQLNMFDFGVEDLEPFKLISKEKVFTLQPITVEEAIDELEHTDYLFYVFKNISDNDAVSIIYKRHNDEYGLIKCI